MSTDDRALLPLKHGDNFIIGPYHFVYMGWKNGRIKAMRHDQYGIYMHSLSIEVALSPGFKIVGQQKAKKASDGHQNR